MLKGTILISERILPKVTYKMTIQSLEGRNLKSVNCITCSLSPTCSKLKDNLNTQEKIVKKKKIVDVFRFFFFT